MKSFVNSTSMYACDSTNGRPSARRGLDSLRASSSKRSRNRGRRGFTLLELLVAVSIFSLVGAGLAALLSTGIQIKKRARRHENRLQVSGAILEELQRNLRNVVPRGAGSLRGGEHEISFFAQVSQWQDGRRTRVRILDLDYRADAAGGRITKTVSELGGRSPARSELVDGGVKLRFAYLAKAELSSGAEWRDSWSQDDLPMAVRISLVFPADTATGREVVWSRVARIPLFERIDEQGEM